MGIGDNDELLDEDNMKENYIIPISTGLREIPYEKVFYLNNCKK